MGIHVKPSDAMKEIGGMEDVYQKLKNTSGIEVRCNELALILFAFDTHIHYVCVCDLHAVQVNFVRLKCPLVIQDPE